MLLKCQTGLTRSFVEPTFKSKIAKPCTYKNEILSCTESAEKKMLLGKSEEQNLSTKIFAKLKDYS